MSAAMDPDADQVWMRRALDLARRGAAAGEVPVGAVVILDGAVIGEGCNQPIASHDPSAHAEMLALREACRAQGNYRLPGARVYTTLEPCPMCAGALIHARVEAVVYGARDPKWGGCGSVIDIPACEALNHRLQVRGGVLAEEAAGLLQEFFRARRC